MRKWIWVLLMVAMLLCGCEEKDYEQAMALFEAGDFSAASRAFEALGDYENSAQMVTACQYAMAVELYEAGDWLGAEGAFDALGDYQDSAQRVTACRYGLAETLLAEGDYLTAAQAFEALGDYADAVSLSQDARWLALQDLVSRQTASVTVQGVRVYLASVEDDPQALTLCAEKTMDLGFYSVTDRCGITLQRGQSQGRYFLQTDTRTVADGLTGYTLCSASGIMELAAVTADTVLPLTDFSYYSQDVYGNVTQRTEPGITELVEARGLLRVLLEQIPALLEQSGYTLQSLGLTGVE